MIKIRLSKDQLELIEFKHLLYCKKFVLPLIESNENLSDNIRDYLKENFKKIILGKPLELEMVIDYFDGLESKNVFTDIFNYSKFVARKSVKRESDFFSRLNVDPIRINNKKKKIDYLESLIRLLSEESIEIRDSEKHLLDNEFKRIKERLEKEDKVNKLRVVVQGILASHLNYTWGAYDLVKSLDVNVCPYCNRNYISVLESKSGKTRPELDHFYPKSIYPYLGLSLYNLIPSCHVCNSNLKGSYDTNSKDGKCLNPHKKGFESELIFEVYDDNLDYLIEDNNHDFDIALKEIDQTSEELEFAKNSAELFKLKELYSENHKDIVIDIINIKKIYNEAYLNELMELNVFKTQEELRQTILGNYVSEKDFSKRPLSKFTKDISDQLNLFE